VVVVVTLVGDRGGGGGSSLGKMNVREFRLTAAFERVGFYLIPCWKPIRIQWNIQGIRTWFPKT
jgi:hypothetical protein